jgi:hypothetical protein
MARAIKRLSSRSNQLLSIAQLRRRDPDAWEKALGWWGDLGINTMLLITLLAGARAARNQFEEQLEARRDPLTTRKVNRARRALKRAEPLICLFKTESALDGSSELFFGDLGEQIERSVQNYVEAVRTPALPAHHPGEPWLRKKVLLLTRLLRARDQSWKQAARTIHALFDLAGHGDVATAEKIRHYIREARKRDPKFGAAPLAALGLWFSKDDGRPTPSESEPRTKKQHRSVRFRKGKGTGS